jgi:hypothetical protein
LDKTSPQSLSGAPHFNLPPGKALQEPAEGVQSTKCSHTCAGEQLLESPSQPQPETPGDTSSAIQPREIGGPKGPEPTRYGDWEKGGRCIDF